MTTLDQTTRLACSSCGEFHDTDALTPFGDSLLCPTCLERETFVCNECGERFHVTDDHGDEHIHICRSCRDCYYTCTHCGRLVHEDDACYPTDSDDVYCDNCSDYIPTNRAIFNYGYKPTPFFHGKGKRYFGVELEIDNGGLSDENARVLLNIANATGENLYC